VVGVQALVDALDLEPTGEGAFRAQHVVANGYGVVFGGQLLAQSLVAGVAGHEGKRVKTLHTIFARGASPDAPLEIEVEAMHAGRSFASTTVTIRQDDRLCTRSLLLLSADDEDVIHHQDDAPWDGEPPTDDGGDEWAVRIVDDVDVADPDAVGPPDLDVWSRFPGAPSDPGTGQALLAFASDGFLIGTAMRPHPGVGQS
jgi:acyl-CoA thioesterase